MPEGPTTATCSPASSCRSTLSVLLLRLYDPQEGRIEIDGHDIREWKTASVRRQIGLLPQDALMFAASIRDNLACAAGRKVSDAEIIEAAKLANAHDFITALPEGYDTVIGERGATLSGGQRQRLAIARLALRRCPIVVLDEPTAALDLTVQLQVLKLLVSLQQKYGLSYLLITHDMGVIRALAHRLLVMKDGVVVEQGAVEEIFMTPASAYTRELLAASAWRDAV